MDLVGVNTPLQGCYLIQDIESGRIKFDGDAGTAQPIPNKMTTLSAIDRLKIK